MVGDQQQNQSDLPKSRLGSWARVEQDAEAYERARLKELRSREETYQGDDVDAPPWLNEITELEARNKTGLEKLRIDSARLKLDIAKREALKELWISHEAWEQETGREHIAKDNPYAKEVCTPDEHRRKKEETLQKYMLMYSPSVATQEIMDRSKAKRSSNPTWQLNYSAWTAIIALVTWLAVMFSIGLFRSRYSFFALPVGIVALIGGGFLWADWRLEKERKENRRDE